MVAWVEVFQSNRSKPLNSILQKAQRPPRMLQIIFFGAKYTAGLMLHKKYNGIVNGKEIPNKNIERGVGKNRAMM